MKATELRLGNWIQLDDGDYFKVAKITDDPNDYDFFSGIPLTPEILEKVGFVFNENYDNHRIQINEYFYSVKKVEDKWYLFNDSSDASCYILTELKYLHQLQNIIFALEHIELPIEL